MQATPDDPLTVAHSLDKLLVKDCVQVELIPEKKGLFLKHVEYQVTSQASGSNKSKTNKGVFNVLGKLSRRRLCRTVIFLCTNRIGN